MNANQIVTGLIALDDMRRADNVFWIKFAELVKEARTMETKCRRYIDDNPGARADCEYMIAQGKRCSDCPVVR